MRLVFCNACKTLEEIPDLEVPGASVDPLLEEIVRKHNERDPMAHGGAQLKASPMRVFSVDELAWKKDRRTIIKMVNEENKKVGFDAWVYEAMNTYAEDAMRCFREHHRPSEGCIDWREDSKKIGHPTEEGQKQAHEQYKLAQAKDPYLCDFCPVKSWVDTQKRHKAGLYRRGNF